MIDQSIFMKLRNRKQRDWEIECRLDLGSPTPRPQTGGGPHPVRSQVSQQEESGRQAGRESGASSASPVARITA